MEKSLGRGRGPGVRQTAGGVNQNNCTLESWSGPKCWVKFVYLIAFDTTSSNPYLHLDRIINFILDFCLSVHHQLGKVI